MTNNIIPLRGRPFNSGFDPRRNLDGAKKGTNLILQIKKRIIEKHTEDVMDIVQIVINQAKEGNEKSQSLILAPILKDILTDLAADNCEYEELLNLFINVPKDELEEMRNNVADQLSKYNNDNSKGDEE